MSSRRVEKGIHQKLEIIAKQNGVSVEEVRRDIEQMIHACMNSPNAIVRARWAQIPRKGQLPTVEEVIAYGAFETMQKMEE